MVRITKYDASMVDFYCTLCQKDGNLDINNRITDNCALDIEVECPHCGDKQVLFFIKCNDMSKAMELQARMEFLKVKWNAGVGNGY